MLQAMLASVSVIAHFFLTTNWDFPAFLLIFINKLTFTSLCRAMLTNDDCISWYYQVGDFCCRFGIGERNFSPFTYIVMFSKELLMRDLWASRAKCFQAMLYLPFLLKFLQTQGPFLMVWHSLLSLTISKTSLVVGNKQWNGNKYCSKSHTPLSICIGSEIRYTICNLSITL